MVAELIREAALEGVRDELPHSIAVVVEEMLPREDRPADKPLLDIHANLYIERSSQKGIVIGPEGKRLKDVGIKSRKQIEALLGTPSSSTCTSRWPRTGSGIPSSCGGWASDLRVSRAAPAGARGTSRTTPSARRNPLRVEVHVDQAEERRPYPSAHSKLSSSDQTK
ncbi:GTPase Era [Streptomyces griseoloalbus]